MSEETEIGTQTLDSSSDTIELKFGKEREVDTPVNEISANELTLRSVNERIKQATDPIFRRVEILCASLVSRTEIESAGNSKISPSRNRYDKCYLIFWQVIVNGDIFQQTVSFLKVWITLFVNFLVVH